MPAAARSTSRNVVLVHGGFVDGSGWEAVYRSLRSDGYTVSVVQNPTIFPQRRRARDEARHRGAERHCDTRRTLIWRGSDYRSWQR